MLVLGIDTTTKIASVGLYDDKKGFLGEINLFVKTNHSNVIMSMVDNLFKMTKFNINDVDKIAVSIGPGSFTGIRIGVAIAKGLAFGSKKTIAGINELDMIANLANSKGTVVALLDARKKRVYSAIYRDGEKIVKDEVGELSLVLEKFKNSDEEIIFVGDGAIAYRDIIIEELGEKAKIIDDMASISRAVILAKMALDREDNLYTLEPFYVNKSQAEQEKEARDSKKQ